MNPQSTVAIEYIHITNLAIATPECMPDKPLVKPPAKPLTAQQPLTWWVIVIIVCLTILAIVIIVVSIYCAIDSRRNGNSSNSAK